MTAFAVWVEFCVKPEVFAEFGRLVRENASVSLACEPGCRRFDILSPRGEEAGSMALYEIYDSEAAFEAHLASGHYRAFAAAASAMLNTKSVRTFAVHE